MVRLHLNNIPRVKLSLNLCSVKGAHCTAPCGHSILGFLSCLILFQILGKHPGFDSLSSLINDYKYRIITDILCKSKKVR